MTLKSPTAETASTATFSYGFVVPAYDAEATIGAVIAELRSLEPQAVVVVVDDGSRDRTAEVALSLGARLITHEVNRGKGAALRSGLGYALSQGWDCAVSVDADGQHPPLEAVRIARYPGAPAGLVLGVRELKAAGAPRANQISNGISNFFLSLFARRRFRDTQCGLRRYPLPVTLKLGAVDDGYAYEAEVLLRASRAGLEIVELPVDVYYPPESERVTHFHSVRDPARIVRRVVLTLLRRAPLRGADSLDPPQAGSSSTATRASAPPVRVDEVDEVG